MILNIQEIHDLVFWGARGVGFSVSFENTQTYIGQVHGPRREQNKGQQSLLPYGHVSGQTILSHIALPGYVLENSMLNIPCHLPA